MPAEYQNSPLSKAVALLVAGRVLVLRQIAESLIGEPISTDKS